MSKKLHVQKKHVIEYAEKDFFNYDVDDVNGLIVDFCPSFWGNDDSSVFSDEIEVDAEEFNEMIETLKTMGEEKFKEEYKYLSKEVHYETLLKGFTYLYENRDKNNSYINLSWF